MSATRHGHRHGHRRDYGTAPAAATATATATATAAVMTEQQLLQLLLLANCRHHQTLEDFLAPLSFGLVKLTGSGLEQ